MKTGKISENVLKRSILKEIRQRRSEAVGGAAVGGDCAFLRLKGDILTSTAAAIPENGGIRHALISASNNIAVRGGEAVAVQISAVFPADTEELELKETMREIESCCEELNLQITGGNTEISKAVSDPVISVTAIGHAPAEVLDGYKGSKPGEAIVMMGKAGLEATAFLAKDHEEELKRKFPPDMVDKAMGFGKELSVSKAAAIAGKSGVSAMHDVSEGGVFAALWELAERSDVGLEADLRKIPIRQETIEICNFFDLNPYELLSGGAIVATTGNAEGLIMALSAAGIEAAVIGICTDSNDRVLINGESRRFLERP